MHIHFPQMPRVCYNLLTIRKTNSVTIMVKVNWGFRDYL